MLNKILKKFGYRKTKYPTIDELVDIVKEFLDYLGIKHKKTYTFVFSTRYPHFVIKEIVPLDETYCCKNNFFCVPRKNICLCSLIEEYCHSTPEEFFNFLGEDILRDNRISPFIHGFVTLDDVDKQCGCGL